MPFNVAPSLPSFDELLSRFISLKVCLALARGPSSVLCPSWPSLSLTLYSTTTLPLVQPTTPHTDNRGLWRHRWRVAALATVGLAVCVGLSIAPPTGTHSSSGARGPSPPPPAGAPAPAGTSSDGLSVPITHPTPGFMGSELDPTHSGAVRA